jgi:phosphatidylserine decarboxylase
MSQKKQKTTNHGNHSNHSRQNSEEILRALKQKRHNFRVGRWIPSDHDFLQNWINKVKSSAKKNDKPLLPVIEGFKNLIETDPELYMLFHDMFSEVPRDFGGKDPTGNQQIFEYEEMLRVLNHIMTEPPEFNSSGLVGFPINAILNYSLGTTSGFAAFLNKKVNAHLKIVLNEWAVYLSSADSCKVLTQDEHTGWLGKEAQFHMFGDYTTRFEDVFQCNPELPHYGFKSWDDFFTREFVAGQRPVAYPDDDSVIVNACESAPYRVEENVKEVDKFWIKGQPYSLSHMLGQDPLTSQFVGGTIYQAFLSALSYHRWHSPVSGTIVKTRMIDGTYYSEARCVGYDESAPNASQGYITEVATRGLIFIEADNKDIGLMCFMAVGMAEVSTCQITVYEGQHVTKGDQLGMFHFGGSTHCLIFRPEVKVDFDLHGLSPGLSNTTNIHLRERIATVRKSASASSN